MAIQNASDLLVYRVGGDNTDQVTKITVADTPLSGAGYIKANNVTDDTGTTYDNLTLPDGGGSITNTKADVAAAIRTFLISHDYTCTSVVDGVFSATNETAGYVPTLSFSDGSVTIDEGGITVEVTTPGDSTAATLVAYSTSGNMTINRELRDSTTKDSSGWSAQEPGLLNFEISVDALQDFEADVDFQEFYNDIGSTTAVTIRFAQKQTGATDKYYEGSAFITSVSMDAGVEENTTYSATFTGTGVLTDSTW
jgi:TP901-1 family phage major tail protein